MRRHHFLSYLAFCAAGVLIAASARAEIRLPSIFSDHMVIQQGERIPVWGWADPGVRVTVQLGNRKRSTRADDQGNWRVVLPPFRTGGPRMQLVVSGDNTVTINDVLVGEVWVCSGQSNMQWTVQASSDSDSIIAAADYPNIRMFTVRRETAEEPQVDCEGSWVVCSPDTVAGLSAVGFHFARELYHDLDVPIGMIHTSWGGTPVEAWTTIETLQSDPLYEQIIDRAEKEMIRVEYRAAHLYNAMIAPLIPYRIKGAIWYQGEANVAHAWQYRELFPAMIGDWRREWGEGDFPFYFVQLAPFRYQRRDPRECAELRDAQVGALSLPNTGMAVLMDIGNPGNIHPRNKHDVGRRLALWALAKDYGRDIVYSGPLYESMEVEGNRIRVSFSHTGSGLKTSDGEAPSHFQIAGIDRKFVEAEARLEGDSMVVWAEGVSAPVAVRYAWRDDAEPNLFNAEGLPASPFRTDGWPGMTNGRK